MIYWIEINVVEIVSDYGYVGYLWFVEFRLIFLKLLMIMDMLDIFVKYSC